MRAKFHHVVSSKNVQEQVCTGENSHKKHILIKVLVLEFFAGFPLIPATFPTYQTPTYSNAAFRLLAYAIADITGKSFGQTLQDAVLSPLGLNDTSLTAPSIQDAVVVKGDDAWNFDLGDDSP